MQTPVTVRRQDLEPVWVLVRKHSHTPRLCEQKDGCFGVLHVVRVLHGLGRCTPPPRARPAQIRTGSAGFSVPVRVWQTAKDTSDRLTRKPDIHFTAGEWRARASASSPRTSALQATLDIDPGSHYQEVRLRTRVGALSHRRARVDSWFWCSVHRGECLYVLAATHTAQEARTGALLWTDGDPVLCVPHTHKLLRFLLGELLL